MILAADGRQATGIGDEGGFAPPIRQPHEALDLLITAVENCGYTGKVQFGIDPAFNKFFKNNVYDLDFKAVKRGEGSTNDAYDANDLAALYNTLTSMYPITLLEDTYAQDNWQSWTTFNKGCKTELVGDDLLATNVERVKEAEERQARNALLLKITQIGTIKKATSA